MILDPSSQNNDQTISLKRLSLLPREIRSQIWKDLADLKYPCDPSHRYIELDPSNYNLSMTSQRYIFISVDNKWVSHFEEEIQVNKAGMQEFLSDNRLRVVITVASSSVLRQLVQVLQRLYDGDVPSLQVEIAVFFNGKVQKNVHVGRHWCGGSWKDETSRRAF